MLVAPTRGQAPNQFGGAGGSHQGFFSCSQMGSYKRATHDRFEDGCRVAEADHGQRRSREDQGSARCVGAMPLAAIDDLVVTASMTVQVQWISSSVNKTDELTRVPYGWVKGSRPVMLRMSLVPVASVPLDLFTFRSSRSPVPRRSIRIMISSPNQARTLINQMIQCKSCTLIAARSARRRMNLVGKLLM